MTEYNSQNNTDSAKDIFSEDLINKLRKSINYCYDCNRCVNVCPVSLYGAFYPRNLFADIEFLGVEESLKKNNVWACLTCSLCMEYCPMSTNNVGVNILDVILNLRSLTTEYQPLQNEKIACQHNRTYSNLPSLMANDMIKIENKIGFLKNTGLKFKQKGEIAYFIGCLPFMNSIAPCSIGCSAGIDVQGYISLIREGNYQGALDLIREKNPFPAVCGRVCTHPCEDLCNRKYIDDPIHIRALKRYVADWEIENKGFSKIKPIIQDKEKVAIIGSGPSGLTAAYFLARKGYKPTVFEKEGYTGGKLRDSIPEYRLPRDILNYEIEFIKNMGVEIRTNTPIGQNLTFDDLYNEGFKAIMISIGLLNSRQMGITGANLENVLHGLDFLQGTNMNLKEYDFKDKNVGVIGGGSTAVDSARIALRLGAKKVMIIYRRTETEMPALEEDLKGLKEENIEILYLTNPVEIFGDEAGACSEAECVRMELGEPDESGRRRPKAIESSEFKLSLDVLIFALGQVPDLSLLQTAHDKLIMGKNQKIQFNSDTFETNIPGVFIGGDILEGECTAIQAIADGREVAISIDRYLRGKDLKEGRINRNKHVFKRSPIPKKKIFTKEREEMQELSVIERINNFNEIELGYDEAKAIQEANRCLLCNMCSSSDQSAEIYDESSKETTFFYGENAPLLNVNDIDYTKIAKSSIALLNQKGIEPVVLADEKCCGHDTLWQGDKKTFEKLAKYNFKLFKDAGVKKIIFSCSEGYYTWKNEYKKLFAGDSDFDFEIYHMTEYILKEQLLDGIQFTNQQKMRVTYHDDCRLGRLSKTYDPPRLILNKLPFVELVEMQNNKEDALCCGVSAYVSCDDYSKKIQETRIKEALKTGAEYLIVSCPKCLTHFNCYLNEHEELKHRLKIMDLTTFIAQNLFLI